MRGLPKELQTLLAQGFTGTVTLHVHQGAIKQVETMERWRPKPDNGKVELTEVEKGASSG